MCLVSSKCAKEEDINWGSPPILSSETGTVIPGLKKLTLMAVMKQSCFWGQKVQTHENTLHEFCFSVKEQDTGKGRMKQRI